MSNPNDNANVTEQEAPIPNNRPAVWDLVIADMKDRDNVGRSRYGTPLQPFNGRDALVDAYQEALDQVVYLRQEIEQRRLLGETRYTERIANLEALLASLDRRGGLGLDTHAAIRRVLNDS